jgi:hypothetical protein
MYREWLAHHLADRWVQAKRARGEQQVAHAHSLGIWAYCRRGIWETASVYSRCRVVGVGAHSLEVETRVREGCVLADMLRMLQIAGLRANFADGRTEKRRALAIVQVKTRAWTRLSMPATLKRKTYAAMMTPADRLTQGFPTVIMYRMPYRTSIQNSECVIYTVQCPWKYRAIITEDAKKKIGRNGATT